MCIRDSLYLVHIIVAVPEDPPMVAYATQEGDNPDIDTPEVTQTTQRPKMCIRDRPDGCRLPGARGRRGAGSMRSGRRVLHGHVHAGIRLRLWRTNHH